MWAHMPSDGVGEMDMRDPQHTEHEAGCVPSNLRKHVHTLDQNYKLNNSVVYSVLVCVGVDSVYVVCLSVMQQCRRDGEDGDPKIHQS
ncbi:hypothetical protein QTP70_004419 [Hemibagrus guttatus]|uniref:Uncharacterized protein n=1 Tax=Hemibagrus guttatus TaxID=175788 RepID=A0AAE0QXP7_9TELE|nr:hypothetical protein QTP70_004419 [Hemibagrus guttatus]